MFRDRAKRLIQDVDPASDDWPTMRDSSGLPAPSTTALGITSVAEPGLFPEQISAFQNVRRSGDLSVRVSLCLGGWGFGANTDEADLEQRIADTGVSTGFGDEWLRMDTVKFMPDGGIGDRTALMFEHYVDEPDNFGQFVISERELFRNDSPGVTTAAGRSIATPAETG